MMNSTPRCRTCLNDEPDMLFDWNLLVEDMPEQVTYFNCFAYCTRLEKSPTLPQVLCFDCGAELRSSYVFMQKAEEADRILRLAEGQECQIAKEEEDEVILDITSGECKLEEQYEEESVIDHDEVFKEESLEDFVFCSGEEVLAVDISPAVEQRDQQTTNELETAAAEDQHEETSRSSHRRTDIYKPTDKQTCNICNKVYHKNFLRSHIKTVHTERNFLCHLCPMAFKTKTNFSQHLQTHNPDRRHFKCTQCERKFVNRGACERHMQTHQKDRQPAYACNQCEKKFFYRGSLTLHIKLHNGNTFDCVDCGKPFARRVDLEVHMRCHTGDRPFKCSQCDKSFHHATQLKRHELAHEGFVYRCEECGAEYKSHYTYRQHLLSHKLICTNCGKGFGKRYAYKRHTEWCPISGGRRRKRRTKTEIELDREQRRKSKRGYTMREIL